ncbi:MAG TPA: DUF3306 domain-containing protein [Burkholderiales bacterium]|nr:DUF3306 domain-containing protein [Burkholderiales bacterium]
MTERSDKEPFLSRWSRLKREAAQAQPETEDRAAGKHPEPAAAPKEPAPPLPPLDELTPGSDFRAFFQPKVDESLKRAALKKLFKDPHFNVMDGLDPFIEDFNRCEPIPEAMLAGLKQAQKLYDWARGEEPEAAGERSGLASGTAVPAVAPEDRTAGEGALTAPAAQPAEQQPVPRGNPSRET